MPVYNNVKMYDNRLLKQAGFDRKSKDKPNDLKEEIRKSLRIIDEQTAVNRYKWIGLPKGLNENLMERVLYYKGQGMFYKLDDTFYFLPYVLSSNHTKTDTGIDVYGRFTGVSPLPFNGSTSDKEGKPILEGVEFTPVYEPILLKDILNNTLGENKRLTEKSCVLLHDYTKQRSELNIPRQEINDAILDVMADCIPFMRTALLNATGVQGLRIATEAEAANILQASNAINRAALNGDKFVPVVEGFELQELTGGSVGKAEEFLLAMQSLDNFRLSTYGLDNGGLFQKKSHMLEAEQELNAGSVGLINDDGLRLRQYFCTIINTIWGGTEDLEFMWCIPNETTLGVDMNGDGVSGEVAPEDTEVPANAEE